MGITLALVGGGVMGESILKRVIDLGVVQAKDMCVAEVSASRREHLVSKYGVACFPTAKEATERSDTIILAVKPQSIGEVFAELGGHLKPDQLVISIMAGVTLDVLSEGLGDRHVLGQGPHQAIVRVMPNTPAQIGQGMSVWTATPGVSDEQKSTAKAILAALGDEIYVAAEHYLDMATAVSGSGPAYVFLVLEALTDAAVHIGLSRDIAERLALQTIVGSALFAKESKLHPAVLRNMVTSPGGTTTEALFEMEQGGLRGIFMQAVEAAYQKSIALGKKESH